MTVTPESLLISNSSCADDINMKKSSFFRALICVVSGFILLVTVSCSGVAPASPPPIVGDDYGNPIPDSASVEDDIWALLQRGDSRVRGFFTGEVNVNAVDAEGRTPLHYAAERGDAQLASFFISIGANTNARDHSNQSPLGISTERNDARVSEILVTAGADIHQPITNNTTAARIALARSGAVLKAILTPASVASVDADGKTILHLASIEGNVTAVRDILALLLSTSVSVDKKDNSGKNALDYALANPNSVKHIETAEQLILSGASSENPIFSYLSLAVRLGNFNIRRNDGLAPIHHAVINNYAGLITFLMDKNIDVNIKSASGAAPLHEAARAGNIQIMAMLIERGADVNSIDAKGNTALHMGIPANVHREAVNLLLDKGANPNIRDEHGDTPLHIVIILNRSYDVIQTLLGSGSDVHIRNMDGKTPLYIAIQEKRNDFIPILLSYGSEIFAADNSGVTPFDLSIKDDAEIFNLLVTPETVTQRDSAGNTMLHAAVRSGGKPEQIGTILDNRALVDARNMEGDTALHIAVRMNQRENGEYLITRGASVFTLNAEGISPLYLALTSAGGIREWIFNPNTVTAKDGLGNNMLHYASQWKLNNAIPVIIQKGVSVEEENTTGETPLFMAVKNGSPSTIKTLLDNKANISVRDKQGNSLLHTAVRWNAKNSAALLISSGIDINAHSMNGVTALHEAVTIGMSEIETMLIKEGANLEVRDIDGNTPFMEAVRAGLLPSIEKLASNGADPSTRNNRGETPLHIAVDIERYDLVNLILRTGASIHARNTNNRTPFQISISKSPRMVSTLLTNDRINVPDDMGNSALHIALQEKASSEIIRAIINRGVRLNAVDNNGQTPLRLAIDLGLLEPVKILAEAGADPFFAAVDNRSPADIALVKGDDCIRALFSGKAINAKDSSANTILHIAARQGTPETIQTLLELGANKTLKNIASETPEDIAVRWNRARNAELLKI